MTQTSLFDRTDDRPVEFVDSNRPGAHHSNPNRNELKGAQKVTFKTGSQKLRVLQELVNAGYDGCTDHELVGLCVIPLQSVNGRRNWLVGRGYVKDSGRERTGPYDTPNTVWIATAAGHKALQDAGDSTPLPASCSPKDAA